ncbi:hypothetical protein ACH41E_00010 [Streptomyces sp. NPDC020412]|uniref:hypothetical protein n=1 Tax=Streptomyces sp. NPDC020412 TaxID=3365073 RepID=UPI0037B3A264
MTHATTGAALRSQADLAGLTAAFGNLDLFQVRDGGHWLVATDGHDGHDVHAARISPDPGAVFAHRHHWQLPRQGRVYVTPLAGDRIAVSSSDGVALHAADGTPVWTVPHEPWPDEGTGGACAVDPRGGRLLAVTHGGATGQERKEELVSLDLATGAVLSRTVLPSWCGSYAFQHVLPGADAVLLNAAQGQDEAYSLVAVPQGDAWELITVGTDDPFTGSSTGPGDFLTMEVNGDSLTRHFAGARPVEASAARVLPDELVFVGRPGFLDGTRILAAAGEDLWAEEARHFVLDAASLEPIAELDYAGAGDPAPLPLGDGTWLTVEGDSVRRWSTG